MRRSVGTTVLPSHVMRPIGVVEAASRGEAVGSTATAGLDESTQAVASHAPAKMGTTKRKRSFCVGLEDGVVSIVIR